MWELQLQVLFSDLIYQNHRAVWLGGQEHVAATAAAAGVAFRPQVSILQSSVARIQVYVEEVAAGVVFRPKVSIP